MSEVAQTSNLLKKVIAIHDAPTQHWVGDGFLVRSLFSYTTFGAEISPFLLLDRAGPMEFSPTTARRGVGQHPHRGFETVTIVYQGEVAHRDSTGEGGVIGAGDVQWMTAAGGILHEEYHSDAFARSGGMFNMVQLWVNLPAADKMKPPCYQAITKENIPVANLSNNAGTVRVIAGAYESLQGPAHTFSPMQVWDVNVQAGAVVTLPAQQGWHALLVILQGEVNVDSKTLRGDAQLAVLDTVGNGVKIAAETDAHLLWLSGEPIQEPVVGYGPFVMNTREEIAQAIDDFNSGHFGQIHR